MGGHPERATPTRMTLLGNAVEARRVPAAGAEDLREKFRREGGDSIGIALLLELPDRPAAEKFWNEEPFAKNGGYARDARIVRWVFGD
jgi:hypothetical protein